MPPSCDGQHWPKVGFGPEGEKRIAAANALCPGGFTGFGDWAKIHMKGS